MEILIGVDFCHYALDSVHLFQLYDSTILCSPDNFYFAIMRMSFIISLNMLP